MLIYIFTAPPPGPSTSGGSVGSAGVATSSVAAPSSMGLVPAQQAHAPPQSMETPSEYFDSDCITVYQLYFVFLYFVTRLLKNLYK